MRARGRVSGSRVLLWMAIAGLSVLAVVRVQAALVERRENQEEQQAASERRRAERATTSTEPSETAHTELEPRDYDRGDCVTWDQGGDGVVRTEVVDCAEPHLVEVIEPVELPLAADAPYPTPEEWTTLFAAHCRPLVVEHLGGALDPFGRLAEGAIQPLEVGWRQGDRSIWCGVYHPERFGGSETLAFAGRAAELDQSWVLPVGSCLELVEETSKLVPCDAAHHLVVSGQLDLSDLAVRPSDEDLASRCDAVATAAETVPGRTASFLGFDPASWAAGSRRGNCVQGQWDAEGHPILLAGPSE